MSTKHRNRNHNPSTSKPVEQSAIQKLGVTDLLVVAPTAALGGVAGGTGGAGVGAAIGAAVAGPAGAGVGFMAGLVTGLVSGGGAAGCAAHKANRLMKGEK